jgi:hypothetical protein
MNNELARYRNSSSMESIKFRLEKDGIALASSNFTPGQTFRIKGGVFQGIKAVFEREMSDRQRAMVLLQVLSGHGRPADPDGDPIVAWCWTLDFRPGGSTATPVAVENITLVEDNGHRLSYVR